MCEGASWEGVVAELATAIAVYGYALQGVDDEQHEPWLYTIGLLDAADHPELIVAGASLDTSTFVLRSLAERVLAGERFAVGDSVDCATGPVRIGAVHDVQYELDTFSSWHDLEGARVLSVRELRALQVVLGNSMFCHEHREAQPMLSDPSARVGRRLVAMNRAARRRRRHNRGRHRH